MADTLIALSLTYVLMGFLWAYVEWDLFHGLFSWYRADICRKYEVEAPDETLEDFLGGYTYHKTPLNEQPKVRDYLVPLLRFVGLWWLAILDEVLFQGRYFPGSNE